MEAFAGEGLVRDGEGLYLYLSGLAEEGFLRVELPLLKRCFLAALNGDQLDLLRWNQVSLALRESEELLLEERELGAATMRLIRSQGLAPRYLEGAGAGFRPGYLAATGIFAAAMGLRECDLETLLSAFLWALLENQVTAAAKAVPLGQGSAQAALLRLKDALPGIVSRSMGLEDSELGGSLPNRAILSARHEGSHTRMFRS
jgi:urease accessory protein